MQHVINISYESQPKHARYTDTVVSHSKLTVPKFLPTTLKQVFNGSLWFRSTDVETGLWRTAGCMKKEQWQKIGIYE
jgi:hypothetical protein